MVGGLTFTNQIQVRYFVIFQQRDDNIYTGLPPTGSFIDALK